VLVLAALLLLLLMMLTLLPLLLLLHWLLTLLFPSRAGTEARAGGTAECWSPVCWLARASAVDSLRFP